MTVLPAQVSVIPRQAQRAMALAGCCVHVELYMRTDDRIGPWATPQLHPTAALLLAAVLPPARRAPAPGGWHPQRCAGSAPGVALLGVLDDPIRRTSWNMEWDTGSRRVKAKG